MAKTLDQRERDRGRRSYRVYFPSDLDGERIEAWLRSLSGTLIAGSHRWGGVPTMAFEVWATQSGIEHRIKIPYTHVEFVLPGLRGLVPGIRVEPEDDWPERRRWTKAVEIGMSNSNRQLRIFNSSDMAASILTSMQSLGENERLMMQWVISPTTPQRMPQYRHSKSDELSLHGLMTGNDASRDEIQDRRSKLEEPNMLAVLRVAADASTPVRATHLIFRVKAALASARSPHVRWSRRFVAAPEVSKRIALASAPLTFPAQLSVPELAALLAWPIGNPFVSGLPTPLSRQLPVPNAVPPVGRILGRSTMHGHERPVAIGYQEACTHMHVLGPPGVGKTVLLANMIKQDMEKGYGAILIEGKGDLFRAALEYVPPERLDDVIVLDVNDTDNPVGFNILRQGDPAIAVDEVLKVFSQLYRDNPSIWTQELLYHGLHALAVNPEGVFTDLLALINPDETELDWRSRVMDQQRDPQIRQFWKRFDGQPAARRDQMAAPVASRVWPMSRSKLLNIVGQSSSSFTMDEVIRQRKILLVNLAGIESEAQTIMGTFLMNAAWKAAEKFGEFTDKATFLYLDECHRFMNIPVDLPIMMAEARSKRLGLVLAHQDLSQLGSSGAKEAIMHNVRSKVVFQTSDKDAREMANSMGAGLQAQDLASLGRYEAVVRLNTPAGVSQPFTMSTLPRDRGNIKASTVVSRSRSLYGRNGQQVQQHRLTRRETLPQERTNKRPPISGF